MSTANHRRAMQAAESRLTIAEVAALVAARRPAIRGRAMLVAVSGVDGSGKSRLAAALAAAITGHGLRSALVGIDPWQHPQSVRFGGGDPGLHFYHHAIRFDELFAAVVDPLVRERGLHFATLGIRTDRDEWEPLGYDHEDVDVVVLEGILLFKRALRDRYDLRVWIDCTFETALRRALARNVEGLDEARLREDYARIYHAAQRWHFVLDDPLAAADVIVPNAHDLSGEDATCAHE